jgi:hypothetical protein
MTAHTTTGATTPAHLTEWLWAPFTDPDGYATFAFTPESSARGLIMAMDGRGHDVVDEDIECVLGELKCIALRYEQGPLIPGNDDARGLALTFRGQRLLTWDAIAVAIRILTDGHEGRDDTIGLAISYTRQARAERQSHAQKFAPEQAAQRLADYERALATGTAAFRP